ncbi:MAG: ATP-binding protein [Acidobacteriota bacterium]
MPTTREPVPFDRPLRTAVSAALADTPVVCLLGPRQAGTAQLLNVASLANELDLRRETVEHYFAVCERLFLVRRLQPWHRHRAKRLIKTPKVHLVDSGLAATLAGLSAEDAVNRRERFGHLLETFVVQQLIAQTGWTAPELEFWHYRDKDTVEVDLVVSRAREVWGVEVKAAATVTPADGAGLRRLADQCGKDFRGGVVLHAGASTIKLDVEHCLAVPLARLWDM